MQAPGVTLITAHASSQGEVFTAVCPLCSRGRRGGEISDLTVCAAINHVRDISFLLSMQVFIS